MQPAALAEAEASCLDDSAARAARSERRREREVDLDRQYVEQFAAAVRRLYPAAPPQRELEIAEHACLRHSRRIGRTSDAKSFAPSAIELAVRAHVRHRETEYDRLLALSGDRELARQQVAPRVDEALERWQSPLG